MPGALHGIRILDLTSVLMGPSATQMLAEMGAEVVKIEPTGGDTTRGIGPGRRPSMGSNFLNMNRGKRSISLDLKRASAVRAVKRMVTWADVFIHNIRPQAAARLGLSDAHLRPLKPALIYCALTGYGSAGPYAGQAAYDDLIQGQAGIAGLFQRGGGEPRYVPTPVADRVAGLNAVVAVTSSLLYRERTGQGQYVEVPMFESVAHMVLSDHLYGRTHEPPLGPAGYDRVLSAARRPYATSDGWLCVLIYQDRHWQRFFGLVDRPDMASDPRFATMRDRNSHVDELYAWVAQVLRTRSTEDWISLLRQADIPAGPLNSLESLLDDKHLQQSGFFTEVDHPSEGRLRAMRLPMTWSVSTPDQPRPAPNLGEHGPEVLRELGFDESEIATMVAEGALHIPSSPADDQPGEP
jgi:crotonobetainyl-CoA:carnitine CoA-transferase CaiB-like acyl-CoA transferase